MVLIMRNVPQLEIIHLVSFIVELLCMERVMNDDILCLSGRI